MPIKLSLREVALSSQPPLLLKQIFVILKGGDMFSGTKVGIKTMEKVLKVVIKKKGIMQSSVMSDLVSKRREEEPSHKIKEKKQKS